MTPFALLSQIEKSASRTAMLPSLGRLTKSSVYMSKGPEVRSILKDPYPLSYLTGEVGELGEALGKGDWDNLKEEVGDVSYAAGMILSQLTGLNLPLVGGTSAVDKFLERNRKWEQMFEERGVPFDTDYLKGGSNFKKPGKITKAFRAAGVDITPEEASDMAVRFGGGIEPEEDFTLPAGYTIAKKAAEEFYYHGSSAGNLSKLAPRISRVLSGEAAVFGTPDRDVALSFAAPWDDGDIEHGSVDGQMYMREMRPGAFEEIFGGKAGSVYKVDGKRFKGDQRLTRFEAISGSPVDTLEEEKVDDVLAALRDSGKFIMLKYGERAPWEAQPG